MKKIYVLTSSFLILITNIIVAQETNIVPGNLLVMVNSDVAAMQLTKELSTINGVNTNLKVERTLSESMHIYLMSFDETVVNSTLFLNAVKKII